MLSYRFCIDSRFASARSELTADLELVHLLSAATPQMGVDLAGLTEVALAALARSALEYQDAAVAYGLAPGTSGGAPPPAEVDPMSTEELMRLVAEDSPAEQPEEPSGE